MAEEIKYRAADAKFTCGTDYNNISVINFAGPGGSKVSAYSCNMNVDLDGDPQAYAPLSKPQLRPMDNLTDAGFQWPAKNEALKKQYEDGKTALAGLEKKKADLIAQAAAVPDALNKQVESQKEALRKLSFEHTDPDENHSPAIPNPKNFEKIFWKWYGVVALTPEQAKRETPYIELLWPKVISRTPILDQTAYYEDVFGRFPVVQSAFEPGSSYFVSSLPPPYNTRYRSWDQRYFFPSDADDQRAFGALATGLGQVTGLRLNDTVFAIRLDTPDYLSFPFRDTGYGYKVAECSFAAFTGVGGIYHPENEGAAKFPNNFLLLYLAFPGRQTPAATLAKFATASNAADFPVILSFIAQATTDAKAGRSKTVTVDPLRAFETWKKSPSAPKPASFDVIVKGLSTQSDFVQRMKRTHPHLPSGGVPLNR
jgi:hypothetical protein